MSNLSKLALLEISELSHRAEHLARGGASERAQSAVLVQRIKNVRVAGVSSDELRAEYAGALRESVSPKRSDAEHRRMFEKYLAGHADDKEFRDFLAGTQSILYTQGASGGYTVPIQYDPTLRLAMAQVDPVLDEDVTDFTMEDPFGPGIVSGYDLSTISASLVGESVVQNPQVIPTVYGTTLNSNLIFKASFAASLESEQDIPSFADKIVCAAGVALARTIGQHVMTGRGGTTDINGVVNLLGAPLQRNATAGKVVLTDINNWYFSINRFYRSQPKCGWLFNDLGYKLVRNSTDNSGRPLLSVKDDKEQLMGRPVYVSPSLTLASAGVGLFLFGDLGHLVVRACRPQLQRATELSQADVTRGECLYIARMRADSTIFDASQGNNPPIVLGTLN
jgi:HK97 family phage major capsid protein